MWIDKEIGTKKSHFSIKKKCDYMAEKVGFEPTEHCCSTVFKTASLNHSDTSPRSCGLECVNNDNISFRRCQYYRQDFAPKNIFYIFWGKYAFKQFFLQIIIHRQMNCSGTRGQFTSRWFSGCKETGARAGACFLQIEIIPHYPQGQLPYYRLWPASQQLPSVLSRTRWTKLRQPQPRSYRQYQRL